MRNLTTITFLYKTILPCCLISMVWVFTGCASSVQKQPESTSASIPAKAPAKSYKRSTPVTYTKGHQIVSIAESLIGSPYKYGGASPSGFDCSGLVYYTHHQLNITVPRTTKQQARHSPSKPLQSAKPGDILFFRIYGDSVSHVGIYAGNDQFIHAPKSGKYVSYASINEPYWQQRLIKVASLH